MEDFDELLTEIDGLKTENERLETEMAECRKMIAKDIVENLKNVYLPFLDKVKSIEDSFGNIGKNYNFHTEFEGMPIYFNTSNGFLFTYEGIRCVYPLQVRRDLMGIVDKVDSYSDASFTCLAKTFGNSLVAQNFVKKCIDAYSKRLDSIASHYRDSNGKLADSVEKLKTMIAENSKVIKEKEDGSVEITLGGKVYVGHLKEKED